MIESRGLVLYGAGGAGRELAFNLTRSKKDWWLVKGFVDDTMPIGARINGLPVLGGMEWLMQNDIGVVMCVVANPKLKRKLIEQIKGFQSGIKFPRIINEDSIISKFVEFGEGVVIAQPYNYITVNVKIGNFVWINTRSDIGHDVEIGDYTTIYTRVNIGGDVRIGKECVIGSGATIRPGTRIGNGVTIGAGAVVVKDVPDNVTVVGNPAKILCV